MTPDIATHAKAFINAIDWDQYHRDCEWRAANRLYPYGTRLRWKPPATVPVGPFAYLDPQQYGDKVLHWVRWTERSGTECDLVYSAEDMARLFEVDPAVTPPTFRP